ncbi:hypothetical protein, partial [Kineosporia sp. A_224]|uniref:hypothetical protein n=1 Tax=Kineosporia sp. A_224 TaxID=1962180 RepID=UPI001E371E24
MRSTPSASSAARTTAMTVAFIEAPAPCSRRQAFSARTASRPTTDVRTATSGAPPAAGRGDDAGAGA